VLVLLALLIGIILGAVLAHGGETTRVDLFDTRGQRTGYAVVDRDTGRVDFYDATSRHTGYGRVDGTGKVERFGLDGKRQDETAVPVVPRGEWRMISSRTERIRTRAREHRPGNARRSSA
jgi:hypothetical protein